MSSIVSCESLSSVTAVLGMYYIQQIKTHQMSVGLQFSLMHYILADSKPRHYSHKKTLTITISSLKEHIPTKTCMYYRRLRLIK